MGGGCYFKAEWVYVHPTPTALHQSVCTGDSFNSAPTLVAVQVSPWTC